MRTVRFCRRADLGRRKRLEAGIHVRALRDVMGATYGICYVRYCCQRGLRARLLTLVLPGFELDRRCGSKRNDHENERKQRGSGEAHR